MLEDEVTSSLCDCDKAEWPMSKCLSSILFLSHEMTSVNHRTRQTSPVCSTLCLSTHQSLGIQMLHQPLLGILLLRREGSLTSGLPSGTTPWWGTKRGQTPRALGTPYIYHPGLPGTSWSILTIKKDLHANFRFHPSVLFAKSVGAIVTEGNPERQGNGRGWLLMGPSSLWAVSSTSPKHTFGVQVQQGGRALWFVDFRERKKMKSVFFRGALYLRKTNSLAIHIFGEGKGCFQTLDCGRR